MNEAAAATALKAAFAAAWTGLFSAGAAPQVTYQNDTSTTKPTDPATGMPVPFLYFEIEFTPVPAMGGGEIGQLSIGAPGNNLVMMWGLVAGHAFVPVGAGDDAALQICAKFKSIFQGQDLGGVTCKVGSIRGGDSKSVDGLYYGRTAVIPFYFEDVA